MSSSTISKNQQLYSGYDVRSVADSQVYNLLYNADLWVDASDTSTFTLTGSAIQQTLSGTWNDKSKNANNLTPSTTTYYDAGHKGFFMNGQFFTPTTLIPSTNNECFLAVLGDVGTFTSSVQHVLGYNPTVGTTQRLFRIDNAGLTTLNSGTTVLAGSTFVSEARRVLVGFNNNNGFFQHFINGRLDGTAASVTTFNNSTNPTIFFGAAANPFRGTVHEAVFFSSSLSSSQRQLIEYYLINKWKTQPTAITNPTSITGCRLWLDASDASSITTSGSSVTQWNDKSGYTNHATGVTSFQPTYTSGTPQINFSGSQALRTNYVATSSTETMFVVFKMTTITANNQYLITTSDATNGRNYYVNGNGNNKWAISKGASVVVSGILQFTTQNYTLQQLYCATIGSTGSTHYINKVNDVTNAAANTSVAGTYTQIGASSTSPTLGIGGSISEVVAYNVVLSGANRELVANYLMNKWSIGCLNGTYVNVYNAYQRIPPQIRYFTPNDLENCVLWLDGADLSTLYQDSAGTTPVTATGQSVGFWRDKSVTKNNATQSTVGNQPTITFNGLNGLSVLNFNGANTNYLSLTPTSPPAGSSTLTLFVVLRSTDSTSTQYFFTWVSNAGSGLALQYLSSGLFRCFITASATAGSDNSGLFSINNYCIYSGIAPYAPLSCWGWVNGTSMSGRSGTTGPYAIVSIGRATIGASYTGSYVSPMTGQVAEIIIYLRALGNGEREMVEGYLANKWGLRTNLPSTHTIKDIISLSPPFTPTSISSCFMWYDASDLSTITYASGSTVNVTNMKDKSGRGYDVVRDVYTAGREITTANKLNGLTTLTFPGDPANNNGTLTYMRSTTSLPLTSAANYVFFVMRFNPFVLEGTSTARSWPYIFPFQIGVVNGAQGGMTRSGTNWYLNYNIAFVGNGATGTALISNSSSGPSVGTPFIGMFGKTAAAQYVFSYNGTYETLAGTSATIAGGQPFSMAPFFQGQELCEMVYYTGRILTTGEIQKIEGYLAWKWGLQGNLPSTHSYKKYAP